MSNTQQSTFRVVAIRQPHAVFEPGSWRPPLNVYETEQGIQIVAELAGMTLDGMRVQVQPNRVQIQGTRQLAAPAGLLRIHRLEIAGGPFQINIPLSVPVDPDHSEARYEDGLLNVWMPFAPQVTQGAVVIPLGKGKGDAR